MAKIKTEKHFQESLEITKQMFQVNFSFFKILTLMYNVLNLVNQILRMVKIDS